MNKIRQSFAWWCMKREGTDPKKLLTEAKKMGYEGVEMIPQDLWPAVHDAGLVIATEGGHNGIASGFNRKSNWDRICGELEAKLELAVKWQIPNLICFSGNREGQSDEKGMEVCIEGLRKIAPAAEQAGVTLIVELLNSKVDHADYQCDHTDWGAVVCRAVDSPRVKLLYDIYHMQIMEGDIIRTLRENIDHIAHFHTAGNPGRHDMDDTQELCYPGIMKAIAETNYSGFVGQEFGPKGDPIEAMKIAYDLCNV